MKPSEKIYEIGNAKKSTNEISLVLNRIDAIIEYLDEEWEKKHNHPVGTKCNEC